MPFFAGLAGHAETRSLSSIAVAVTPPPNVQLALFVVVCAAASSVSEVLLGGVAFVQDSGGPEVDLTRMEVWSLVNPPTAPDRQFSVTFSAATGAVWCLLFYTGAADERPGSGTGPANAASASVTPATAAGDVVVSTAGRVSAAAPNLLPGTGETVRFRSSGGRDDDGNVYAIIVSDRPAGSGATTEMSVTADTSGNLVLQAQAITPAAEGPTPSPAPGADIRSVLAETAPPDPLPRGPVSSLPGR